MDEETAKLDEALGESNIVFLSPIFSILDDLKCINSYILIPNHTTRKFADEENFVLQCKCTCVQWAAVLDVFGK